MDEYPDELKGVPLPVVALVGNTSLVTQLQPHWTVKKIDGKDEPILRVLPRAWSDEIFPRRIKERRPNYDGYYPDGILKANWLYRYFYEVTACMALFFDFEEEEGTDWRNKEGEITYRIDYFRQLAKNRNIKLVIVLVKNDLPSENAYDEKLNSLRKRAELDARSIHFFAKNDLRNSTKRLEKVLLKTATDYYIEDAKSRKKYRERINRSTQQKLLVRIHLKVAFLNELAQNNKAALKYYVTSYNFLRDSYKLKSELEEVKTVADYLNYKVCKLYMDVGAVNDAVTHFSKHIKYYKTLPTDADKEFLHFSWLARQHQVFGELLDQYPQYSSRVKGWRQSSFHYQAAANFNSMRKKSFSNAKKDIGANPGVTALVDNPQLTPYRPANIIYKFQRFVGKGVVRAVLMQLGKDEKDITKDVEYQTLIAQELKIDHNAEIVTLLLKAFDKIKAELGSVQASSGDRSQYQLAAQIAEQYVEMGRWLEAKSYLDLVVPNYRSEGWYDVLTVMLKYSMEACFKLDLINEAVKYGLELLGPNIIATREEKSAIQSNIQKLIDENKLTAPIVLNSHNTDLLNCTVRFVNDKAPKQSQVEFQLLIEGKFLNDVQFSAIKVSFSDDSYDFEVSKEDLLLEAEKHKIISKHLQTNTESVVECTQVELRWGTNSILFKSTPGASQSSDDHETNYFLLKSKYNFEERAALVILPQPPMLELSVKHAQPALLNELYCLELQMTNKHAADPITEAMVYLDVMHSFGDNSFYMSEDVKIDNNQIPVKDPIAADATRTIRFFVLNSKIESKEIKIKVVYTCASGFSSQVITQVPVNVIFPFVPAFDFFSKEFHAITPNDLSQSDEFMLLVAVKALTDFPLEVLGVDLMINVTKEFQPVANKTSSSTSSTDINFELTRDNKFQTCFVLQPSVVGKYDIGFVTLKWRRKLLADGDVDRFIPTTTQLIIPSVKVQQKFFTAKIEHADSGIVNELFSYTVTVTNHTNAVQDLNVSITDSEFFLIGGPRKTRVKINANSTYNIEWGLLPLGPGRLPLPNIEVLPVRLIAAINASAYLNEFDMLTKPRYVFFVPSNKTPQATL